MYRTETPDILGSVVEQIDRTMTITDYSVNGTTHSIEVCDLKWVEPGRDITIDGNTYRVTAINNSTNIITATGAESVETNTFELYPPIFFYGTPLDQDQNLKGIRETNNKTPMVYLLLNYDEDNDSNDESSIEREIRCRLFFLTSANFDTDLTADLHENKIKPMARLMQLFVDALKANRRSFDTEAFKYNSTPGYKFGVYVTNAGTKKSFFVDQLSGWDMRIDNLIVRRGHNCTSCRAFEFPSGIGSMSIGDDFTIT